MNAQEIGTNKRRKSSPRPERPNWMEIDLSALDNNYQLIRAMVDPHVRIHASVKSAAYGLGLVEVTQRLVGLGVETISCGAFEDASKLRDAGFEKLQIVMFGGTLPYGIPKFLERGLIPTIHNMELASAVSEAAIQPAKVYVKVDFGWGRLGIPAHHARKSVAEIARMPRLW